MNKEEYKARNEQFMADIARQEGVELIGGGIYYRIEEAGEGDKTANMRSVVTCHYRGSLISGKVFDDSWQRHCPEAFRVADLINGFSAALCKMHKGDRWTVYIPWDKAYGKRGCPGIPPYSTLIFEIHLISIN